MLHKYYLSIAILFGFLTTQVFAGAGAGSIDKIESYGIYLKAKEGYVKIKPYKHLANRFVEFEYLNELPSVQRDDKKLKLIVYKKDFKEIDIAFALQPMQNVIEVRAVSFDIKPLDKPDMYELSVEQAVADGTVVLVSASNFLQYNFGAVILGNTQKHLETYFGDTTTGPYSSASLSNLKKSIKAFPDNKKLKALLPKWEKIAESEKDKKSYGYVDAAWRKYEGTKKLSSQAHHLKRAIGKINVYLKNHPKGNKTKEAATRKAFAEKKLKQIKEQL